MYRTCVIRIESSIRIWQMLLHLLIISFTFIFQLCKSQNAADLEFSPYVFKAVDIPFKNVCCILTKFLISYYSLSQTMQRIGQTLMQLQFNIPYQLQQNQLSQAIQSHCQRWHLQLFHGKTWITHTSTMKTLGTSRSELTAKSGGLTNFISFTMRTKNQLLLSSFSYISEINYNF